jgi:DNA-binding transcriptional MocR family regulator
VLYVGTFSKTLFPALRLGYLAVPEDLVDAFERVLALMDYVAPSIEQAVRRLAEALWQGGAAPVGGAA